MIQVYRKNDLYIIENTVTDTIYPNLTKEEAIKKLNEFDRDDPEDRCKYPITDITDETFKYSYLEDMEETIKHLNQYIECNNRIIEQFKNKTMSLKIEISELKSLLRTNASQENKQLIIKELEDVKEIIWENQDQGNQIDNAACFSKIDAKIRELGGEPKKILDYDDCDDESIVKLKYQLGITKEALRMACEEIDCEFMYGVHRTKYPQYFEEQAEKKLEEIYETSNM